MCYFDVMSNLFIYFLNAQRVTLNFIHDNGCFRLTFQFKAALINLVLFHKMKYKHKF
jgi:hypothetical protein